jgi:membrane-associated phospholipid phosphatase
MDTLTNILIPIGEFSPLIVVFIILFGLQDLFLCVLVILDFFIINPSIKTIIGKLGLQSKRPRSTSLSSYKTFGMPSGHTEIQWIILSYLSYQYMYGNLQNVNWLIFFGLLNVIVMWQRWYVGAHSLEQIVVGAVTGSTIGLLGAYISQRL